MFCDKIILGLIRSKFSYFFQCNNSANTRGHAYKLYSSQYANSARTNFFASSIVNVWNSLPAIVDFNSQPLRGLSNVQICLHSCCVTVRNWCVIFIAFTFYFVHFCHVSTVLCHILRAPVSAGILALVLQLCEQNKQKLITECTTAVFVRSFDTLRQRSDRGNRLLSAVRLHRESPSYRRQHRWRSLQQSVVRVLHGLTHRNENYNK